MITILPIITKGKGGLNKVYLFCPKKLGNIFGLKLLFKYFQAAFA